MSQNLLISAEELNTRLKQHDCVVFDCRFSLMQPDEGLKAYLDEHIPTSIYADLDHDLAGSVCAGSGRHPLPEPDRFATFLARSGWRPGKMLVAYDDAGGAIAARLWWLMRYFGHENAALLDGGINAWLLAGLAMEHGPVQPQPQAFTNLRAQKEMVLSTAEVVEGLSEKRITLIDARAARRFAGGIEPIDAVAGHIPGAVNYPFDNNLEKDGSFKSPSVIRAGMASLHTGQGAEAVVHMCGSGVTACHNLLAAEMAGFTGASLYVGSWSEWIQDRSRPVL